MGLCGESIFSFSADLRDSGAGDGVVPYRLEMQTKLSVDGSRDLYDYWGDAIYQKLTEGEERPLIINLASKEYSRAVEPWLSSRDRFVTCVFGEEAQDKNGRPKVKVKATQAKMARGSMVRYLAEIHGETVEDVKGFKEEGTGSGSGAVGGVGAGVHSRKPLKPLDKPPTAEVSCSQIHSSR